MKLAIYSVIFFITALVGLTVYQAANNYLDCQGELGVATTKISPSNTGTKDPIKEAWNSPSCLKMTTLGRVIENVFKK